MKLWLKQMIKPRVIFDTNILISYNLKPKSPIKEAVRTAFNDCKILISQDTFDELQNVVSRFVDCGYISVDESSQFMASIIKNAEWVKIFEKIQACRDPKDDKFLELAINGDADYLITGDQDLLILHPFEGTNILSAKDFVKTFKLN